MDVDWGQVAWDDLVPRLTLFAARRLSALVWHTNTADADDFVIEAITKTMQGVRVWNRPTCSLYDHLLGVIASDINHAAESWENRTMRNPGEHEPGELSDCAADPELVATLRFEQTRLLAHLGLLDPVMGKLAELILLEDLNGTDELSQRLGIAPNQVKNLRKRMKRTVLAYLSEESQ